MNWTKKELRILLSLTTPSRIQAYLDETPYSTEVCYRCPHSVMRDRRAHCFDGAVFAAAALRRLGYPPRLINMFADRDDEHLLAVFQENGHWGAVAKSNFVGLRFREAVYRNLRELVMSYFEHYYNVEGLKTLRNYTRPLSLEPFDALHWMTDDAAMDAIAQSLDRLKPIAAVTPAMVRRLSHMDESGPTGLECSASTWRVYISQRHNRGEPRCVSTRLAVTYASSGFTTLPATSVRRKSRPW